VHVGTTTSVPSVVAVNSIYVFPNPASNMITILPQGTSITRVKMFDILGREIWKRVQPNGTAAITVPVADLANGEYIVQVQVADGTIITKKVIIAK